MLQKKWLLAAAAILSFSVSAICQSNFAALSGSVVDAQGKPVIGARIDLHAKATGLVRSVTTNSDGDFDVPGLSPDEYTVDVSASGFSPTKQQVRLEVGQEMRLNLALSVG